MANRPLDGKVALVAGATRGAGRGIACMLGAAGAVVYCSGRSGAGQVSPMGRPETLEETAALVDGQGGEGVAVRTDHTREGEVAALIARVEAERGRLDILVNDIWGGDPMIDWSAKFWELDIGTVRALVDQAVISHMITARHAAPLMLRQGGGLIVEVSDGHHAGYRGHLLYDLVKSTVNRLGYAMAWDLHGTGVTALALCPGFLRSEAVLSHFGVSEASWRDAVAKDPFFAESESPFFVGRAVAALAADREVHRKAGQVLFAADLAEVYGFTDVDGRRPAFHPMFEQVTTELALGDGDLDPNERFLVLARYLQIHREPDHAARARQLAAKLGFADLGPGLGPIQAGVAVG
ncbi:SDR family oxidoreductase [Phenylobacterium sp.]|uniref:SDR family oxidoreductase n=1 Tax=Phenylobacterium sp. TaxID=1871053 RepID=UPI0027338A86|nr:SDR family oxidoreductase [Phenylobacterium sp.]MDP3853806.1 SDR family oxidoreductase [Phenylobacterium sp.]